MRRLAAHSASALVLALALAVLVGCGTSSTPEKVGTTPAAPTGGSSATPGVGTATEFPPAPANVSGMKDWLAEAYPSAAWLARVKKIEHVPGEVPDSGGFRNAIVVTTDLDFAGEQSVADEITAALGEAHPGWAKQFVIRYADGKNVAAGDIVDRTP